MSVLSTRRLGRRTSIAVSLCLLAVMAVAPRLSGDTAFQRELAQSIEAMLQAQETRRPLPTIHEWVVPVAGVDRNDLVDSFGDWRSGGRRHEGIDIHAPRGTPVVAAAAGVIVRIGETRRGGRCVWIRVSEERELYYGHLDGWRAGMYEGMSVKAGEVLGYVGNSGNAAGGRCHLHFEIRERDIPVNPYRVLRAGTQSQPPTVLSAGGR